MPVVEVSHPLVKHKIGLLREVDISTKKFRELTAERLAIFGVQLDAARNAQMFAGRQGIISRPGSPIVAVIPTNEERMIAEDAAALAPLLEGAA